MFQRLLSEGLELARERLANRMRSENLSMDKFGGCGALGTGELGSSECHARGNSLSSLTPRALPLHQSPEPCSTSAIGPAPRPYAPLRRPNGGTTLLALFGLIEGGIGPMKVVTTARATLATPGSSFGEKRGGVSALTPGGGWGFTSWKGKRRSRVYFG